MSIPEITDETGWREWKVAPRKGLLTSEIAHLIGKTPVAIRTHIRTEKLPGVALKIKGITFAYAATVDDIVAEYEPPSEVVEKLRNLTKTDAPHDVMFLGVPLLHVNGPRVEVTVPTEFEDSREFERANGETAG